MFNLPDGLSRADRIYMGLEEDDRQARQDAMDDYFDNLRKHEAIERAFAQENKEQKEGHYESHYFNKK